MRGNGWVEDEPAEGGAGREREREISFPRKQVGIFLEEGVQALCVFCVSISWCV